MVLRGIRILDFDGSVARQQTLRERYQPHVVDLTWCGPSARIWMGAKTAQRIRQTFDPAWQHAVTFLGSGDFHHVSSLLIEQFQEPLSVIVFDHHPDWDILPPKLHCGSWVTNVLRSPQVKKALLLGVSSSDLSSPWIHSGNLGALQDDRVELYPYAHPPTTVFRRVPDNRSCRVTRRGLSTRLEWQELSTRSLAEWIPQVLKRLPVKRVYVSIDKDCLKEDAALTNWETGRMDLQDVRLCLRLIREHTELVGVDIVGDYSVPVIRGWLKTLCARWDYPTRYSAKGKAPTAITRLNEATNLALLETLLTPSKTPCGSGVT